MRYTNEYSSQSNWSAVLDGFVQLIQLATAAASAKILQDPDARRAYHPGYVVPQFADPKVRHNLVPRFSDQIEQISTKYCDLHDAFKRLDTALLRYINIDVNNFPWEKGKDFNLPHDCVEIDRHRHEITQRMTECTILHARAVSSIAEYFENINKAYVCPPNYCEPHIPPFGYGYHTAAGAEDPPEQGPEEDSKPDAVPVQRKPR